MKNVMLLLAKQFLFWMVFFALLRFTFLIYNQGFLYEEGLSMQHILAAFWHAVPLDIAVTCYILVVPWFLTMVAYYLKMDWPVTIIKYYSLLMIIILSLVTAGEMGVYPEWKTKLSAKALKYLRHPDEAFFSVSTDVFFSLLGIAILLTAGSYFLFRKRIYVSKLLVRSRSWFSPVLFLFIGSLLFIGMRGGVGPIPISLGDAYYSRHSFLNHAAVNSGYHLMISIIESNKFNYKNPFEFMEDEEAEKLALSLLPREDLNASGLLKVKRPNIVIILLESWSADLIASLSGDAGITPRFAQLEKEGYLFRRHYTTGSRSQQAMSAVFGGFPAIPITTITENPEKYKDLPSLVRLLNNERYHTSFFFGGQLNYGNMKAYLYDNEFDFIYEEDDFPVGIPHGRLGVHDEYLFEQHLEHLGKFQEPFFSVAFTLSSHSPYDQPMEKVIDWGGKSVDFLNSVYYADLQLGRYMDMARQQPWYDSTLFIITADHSHVTQKEWPLESFEHHHIPLLLFGPALSDSLKGEYSDIIGMNSDLPATLLGLLGQSASAFRWSRNLFDHDVPQYAYFELQYAFGFKRPEGEIVYGWDWDHFYTRQFDPAVTDQEQQHMIKEGKAYLQTLFQAFIDL